jgi:predicted DNA-binding transcriptional regulator AlpA
MPTRPEVTGRAPLGTTTAETEQPKPKEPVLPHIARRAYRIVEFCAAHGISRSKYYELKKKKLHPHESDLGGVIVVTEEDAAIWRKKRSAATPIIRPKKPSAASKQRARKAVKKAESEASKTSQQEATTA